jgi:hypothetical protein
LTADSTEVKIDIPDDRIMGSESCNRDVTNGTILSNRISSVENGEIRCISFKAMNLEDVRRT